MAEADCSRTIPHLIEQRDRIPAARYFDETFFQLENELLWPHAWQMAARLDQIPDVGDWIEYKILEKSVLVVHTRDGIKANHNACRHRGVRLGKHVEGLLANYQKIIDGYLTGVPREKLTKAIHMLCNNFDGPVLDLGF